MCTVNLYKHINILKIIIIKNHVDKIWTCWKALRAQTGSKYTIMIFNQYKVNISGETTISWL